MSKRALADADVPDAKRARHTADTLLSQEREDESDASNHGSAPTNTRTLNTLNELLVFMVPRRSMGTTIAGWEHMCRVEVCTQALAKEQVARASGAKGVMAEMTCHEFALNDLDTIRQVCNHSFHVFGVACFWYYHEPMRQYVESLMRHEPITLDVTAMRQAVDAYTHELQVQLTTTHDMAQEWSRVYRALLWFSQCTCHAVSACKPPKRYEEMPSRSVYKCMRQLLCILHRYITLLREFSLD